MFALGIALLVIMAVAAGSQAGARRAAGVTLIAQYRGIWTDSFAETHSGDPGPGCGSGQQSGSLTSKVGPGKMALHLSQESPRSVDYLWGTGSNQFTAITFAMKNTGVLVDDSKCGGELTPVNDSGCRAGTKRGQVSFITPNSGGSAHVVPANEGKVKLEFEWDLEPGFDGVGCDPGLSESYDTNKGSPFEQTAQRLDYLKLFRCALQPKKTCRVKLHASKSFSLHQSGQDGATKGTFTIDGQGHLDWSITISRTGR